MSFLLVPCIAIPAAVFLCGWRQPSPRSFLQGKVIWVTGASSGIGEQLAITAAENGAKGVVLSGRREAALEKVRAACIAAGAPGAVQAFDVCDTNGATAQAEAAVKHFGQVDVLVNCAGISSRGRALETKIDVDRQVMEANFFGPVALTKGVLPHMLERGSGALIVINSVQGKLGIPSRTAYAASKHACVGYYDSLRAEVAAAGLTVTSVYPGYVRTSLSLNAVKGDGQAYAQMDATTAAGMDPRDVALSVWRAAAAGRGDVVLAEAKVKLAILLRALFPALMERIMVRRARKAE